MNNLLYTLLWVYLNIKICVQKVLVAMKMIVKNETTFYPKTVLDFERKFAKFSNVRHSITFANGTTAIEAAMYALGLRKGDEVLSPAYTIPSTFAPIVNSGGTIKFVDIDTQTFNVCLDDIKNKISSKNTMLNYGLVLGLTSIFINLIAYAIGIHLDQDWRVGALAFVAMIVIIVLGIKNFKAVNSNLITWGQSVKIGVGISIISALLGLTYNLIFINFIEPDFMNLMMEKQVMAWEEANMTSEQIEGAKSMMETFSSPAITSAIGIIAAAFFGFIISAIAGALLKRTAEDKS